MTLYCIYINGPKCSGKSTFANEFVQLLGDRCIHLKPNETCKLDDTKHFIIFEDYPRNNEHLDKIKNNKNHTIVIDIQCDYGVLLNRRLQFHDKQLDSNITSNEVTIDDIRDDCENRTFTYSNINGYVKVFNSKGMDLTDFKNIVRMICHNIDKTIEAPTDTTYKYYIKSNIE